MSSGFNLIVQTYTRIQFSNLKTFVRDNKIPYSNNNHCRHKSLSLPFLEDHDLLMGIDKIAWPFILSGAWCVFFGLGYAILGKAINKHQLPILSRQ